MYRLLCTCRLLVVLLLCTAAFADELPELIVKLVSPLTNSEYGRTIVPLGDQNDDGYDDFLVWSNKGTYLYYGGNPPQGVPALQIDSLQSFVSNCGDINGDGYDDFASNGRSPSDWRLNIYYGGPAIDTMVDLRLGLHTIWPVGYTVNTGDINRNGVPDLVNWHQDDKAVLFFELESSVDSAPDMIINPLDLLGQPISNVTFFGYEMVSGDFNGDSMGDLAVGLTKTTQSQESGQVLIYFGGTSFDSIPDLQLSRPDGPVDGWYNFGDVLVSLRRTSGPSYSDLYVSSGAAYFDSLGYTFRGGSPMDSVADLTLLHECRNAANAGDLNSDGSDDLIIGRPTPSSGSGYVMIFYGGPDMDSIPDLRIYNADIPEYNTEFGYDVAGVGDVNGDGVDDFAFSTLLAANEYGVYVFSGTGQGTAVDDGSDNGLPSRYVLHQNHPNPFNPVTTISFELPVSSDVRLDIYNVMGRKVSSPINQRLGAGRHMVIWEAGQYASGVYLYRLTAGKFVQTRKMVLVR